MAEKKRKLPPVLKAWQKCREREGVAPFKKMTARQKADVEACVRKELKKD